MEETERLRKRRRWFRGKRKQRTPDASMTIVEHLGELRSRLFISVLAFMGVSVVAFIFYEPIRQFLTHPLCRVDQELLGIHGCDLIFTGPLGGFQFRLKLTAIVGLAASSPVWLYHIWAFTVPALTVKEKRYAVPFIASAAALFLTGATLAYLVLPTGLNFLMTLGGEGLQPLLRADEYLNFIGLMLVAFGVMFELPLVLIFLGLAGVVTPAWLKEKRRHTIVILAIGAAIATPTQDPFTLLVMLALLYVLFELTILILSVINRRRKS
jgi:sec-independent protein translocase protein TatC